MFFIAFHGSNAVPGTLQISNLIQYFLHFTEEELALRDVKWQNHWSSVTINQNWFSKLSVSGSQVTHFWLHQIISQLHLITSVYLPD